MSTLIQLNVRGRPSAFDLSPSNDIIVVASPGCMTFFHLNGLGSPRHVIHYEQPQQIRRVKYQKEGKLGTLRGGIVSFWDPFHSLRPLLGLVQSSGWITDMEWSPSNNNMLATSCDQGEIKIFDIRVCNNSLQTLIMGGACSSISWCNNHPNLLAACNREGFNVWDTRMIGSSTNISSSLLWNDHSIEIGNMDVVNQVTWAHSETPCLITASPSSHLTWWDGQTGLKLGNGGENQDSKLISTKGISAPISCSLLPMPTGRGILTANRVAIEQSREAVEGPATIPRSMSSGAISSNLTLDKSLSQNTDLKEENDPIPHIKTFVNVINEKDHPGPLSTPIWINSFPRREYSLLAVYNPPSVDVNEKKTLTSLREQIVGCSEPILGMRWSTPGRLLPPLQGGLELMFLSSGTSSLHAISISPDIVERYTFESGPYETSTIHSKHDTTKHLSQLRSGHRSNIQHQPVFKMNPPKYSISGLKRNIITPRDLTENTNGIKLKQDQYSTIKNDGRVPDLNKTLSTGNTFYNQLQLEIMLLEEAIQNGNLSGLSISRIDQYARQITLDMIKPIFSAHSNITFPEKKKKKKF